VRGRHHAGIHAEIDATGSPLRGTCLAAGTIRFMPLRRCVLLMVVSTAFGAAACVGRQAATDTGDPGFPFGPTAIGVRPIAYVQDIKPVFDRDCSQCHGGREAQGQYSVGSYANVIAGQRPGDASSPVVVDCSPGGSMYRYFSGDRVAQATLVFRWMVYYNALESR
jgi:hypothetical protein